MRCSPMFRRCVAHGSRFPKAVNLLQYPFEQRGIIPLPIYGDTHRFHRSPVLVLAGTVVHLKVDRAWKGYTLGLLSGQRKQRFVNDFHG